MFKKILKSYDYTLVAAVILLSVFGLLMVYSASMASAVQWYHKPSDFFYQKQKIFLIGSMGAFVLTALVPYKIMQFTKYFQIPMVLVSIIGLAGLDVYGDIAGNAQSWYQIGPIKIQPSEFVKLIVIIYLSSVYSKKQAYINQFDKGIFPPVVYLIIVCYLIYKQPDFGTAMLIVFIAAAIIFSSGMNIKNMARFAIGGIIIGVLFYFVLSAGVFSEKQKERIDVLKDPFAQAQDAGYHLTNSFYAIGSGGVNGLGLGKGIQKLGYLPEAHTDFIMAVIAEELGIWGVGFVILLLGYIVLRGIQIGLKCRDPFGSLLAIGISSMIGIQTFVNLGGVSGMIPLTGVPLPFISYGGSSLLMLGLAAGILVNVSMFEKYEKKYKNKPETKEKEKKQFKRDGNVTYI